MFTSISIKNFRSCSDVHIEDIPSMMVLMGRNGAGKTNVLKAIDWVCAAASKAVPSMPYKLTPEEALQISLSFDIDGLSYVYWVEHCQLFSPSSPSTKAVEVIFKETLSLKNKDGDLHSLFVRDGEKLTLYKTGEITQLLNISVDGSAMVTIKSLLPDIDYHRQISDKIIERFAAVRYYPLNNYEDAESNLLIYGRDYNKALLSDFAKERSDLQTVYKIIRLHDELPEKFGELRSLLGPNGLGLLSEISLSARDFGTEASDKKISITDENTFIFLSFAPFGHDQGFGFGDLSFGTKRIISLFTSMLYDHSVVCLIEQPEDGIHQGLLDKIIPLLKAYATYSQFIFTTHSPAVLNRVEPDEVYLVSMEAGATHVRHLSDQEISAAENYMRNDGPLAEFLESIEED